MKEVSGTKDIRRGSAPKLILKVLAGVTTLIVIAAAALMLTFSSTKLKLAPVEVGGLPPASPPVGMSISALPTGSYQSRAALTYKGGSWSDVRHLAMTALLVRHPKGNLLIDAGAGKNVDEHVKLIPTAQRATTDYTKGIPAEAQLAAGGLQLSDLAGVIPTHAHWDHISGLEDFQGVPVFVNADGRRFIDSKREGTEVINSFRNVHYKLYEFEGGPYLGFPRSHDIWGDGSVVIVPAPGHTPDSIVIFINLPSGTRYAMIGDLVFQREGIELPADKPWLLQHLIGEDSDEVHKDIALIRSASKTYPQILPIAAHDSSAFRTIPTFPASAH